MFLTWFDTITLALYIWLHKIQSMIEAMMETN